MQRNKFMLPEVCSVPTHSY